jgi:hypothetical protein
LLYFYNGTTLVGGYAPGSNNVIDSPYAKLYCAQTSVSGSGNKLTVKWAVSFKPTLFGIKNAYLGVVDMAGASAILQKGTITIANPFYRLYNKTNDDHFYTASEAEKNSLLTQYAYVFTYEGVACGVSTSQGSGMVAFYRLYNKTNGAHFYTADEAEKDNLLTNYSHIFQYEGIACYVYPKTTQVTGSVALYRFWNPEKSFHFYTASEAEKKSIISTGTYTYEGIACYVYPPS